MSDAAVPVLGVALVFAGGDATPATVLARLPYASLVIAADSGLEHAQSLGLAVDLVVGDLDSVDPAALADAEARGAAVERHPAEKDATDLELALNAALMRGLRRLTVVGGYGGRMDHFVANALLLGADTWSSIEIDAWMGHAHVTVVRSRAEVQGAPESLCTLLPVGGAAYGITTDGLRYPLDNEDLLAGSTRGVSNVLIGATAVVTVRQGTVLVIQPNALEERT